jgi:hypothetical protein
MRSIAVAALALLCVLAAAQSADREEQWANEQDMLDADVNAPACRNEFGAVVATTDINHCAFLRVSSECAV